MSKNFNCPSSPSLPGVPKDPDPQKIQAVVADVPDPTRMTYLRELISLDHIIFKKNLSINFSSVRNWWRITDSNR